jgi:hypothetical protein
VWQRGGQAASLSGKCIGMRLQLMESRWAAQHAQKRSQVALSRPSLSRYSSTYYKGPVEALHVTQDSRSSTPEARRRPAHPQQRSAPAQRPQSPEHRIVRRTASKVEPESPPRSKTPPSPYQVPIAHQVPSPYRAASPKSATRAQLVAALEKAVKARADRVSGGSVMAVKVSLWLPVSPGGSALSEYQKHW